ncbi:MAG: GNAT family N-acetyltransferase [Bacteroidales bacterium]|nr:GNAT family N-acetyltransferase [Bacteroidales bacterium]
MMYNFKEITHISPLLADIQALYESAFPADERRDFGLVRELLAKGGEFHIRVATEAATGRMAAFLSYWDFGEFTYIEHLAVESHLRGKGLGHLIIGDFVDNVSRRMVLEVEPPTDVTTRKRIAFYESLGMVLWPDFPYIQPPYAPHLSPVELRLMTIGAFGTDDLNAAVATLRQRVYSVGS